MQIKDLTIVLLAGDPRCLHTIPPAHAESYLTRAVRAAMTLGCPIVLVHHPDVNLLKGSSMITRVPAGNKIFQSVEAGLTACRTEWALVLATDLPYLDSAMLTDFCVRGLESGADVCVALANLEACQLLDPQVVHPILLDGKRYKFGSSFLVRVSKREEILGIYRPLAELKKQPVRLVMEAARRFLSFGLIWQAIRYGIGFLWLPFSPRHRKVEAVLKKKLDVDIRIILSQPELVLDHDLIHS